VPKRWRIEMSLVDDEEDRVVKSEPVAEYDTEEEAKSGFAKKSEAAKKAGEGSE
jgi:hypothetical protein